MIIRAAERSSRRLDGLPIEASRVVGTDHSERLAITRMSIAGEHPSVRLHGTETVYWVLGGDGWFAIDGGRREPVTAGDAILVPAGTRYGYGGDLEYLVIQAPPLAPDSVEFTD